jgi:hypothetical protein
VDGGAGAAKSPSAPTAAGRAHYELLLTSENGASWDFGERMRKPQPQGHVRRLHRVVDHGEQLAGQGVSRSTSSRSRSLNAWMVRAAS